MRICDRQPRRSSSSITARVIARPRPDPRWSGATKITPTQPALPWADAIPVATTASPAAATNGAIVGWSTAQAKNCSRSPKSPRRTASAARATSAASIGRIVGEATAMHPSVPRAVHEGSSAIIAAMPGLSRSDVEHVAHLARLGLTDAELSLLEGQLNHILDQYEKLAELDTDAIAPTAQTIELANILREDVVTPSLPVDEVVRNAPDAAAGYIVSPPILGGE